MRLNKAEVSRHLDALQQRLEPAEQFVDCLAGNLAQPIFCDFDGAHTGFRYAKPDRRHFCLLKYVRAVSALGAGSTPCRLA